jgi:hypothetical protein
MLRPVVTVLKELPCAVGMAADMWTYSTTAMEEHLICIKI